MSAATLTVELDSAEQQLPQLQQMLADHLQRMHNAGELAIRW